MILKFWGYDWEVGGEFLGADLAASNDILNDGAALRARLEQDGYLLIRGLRERGVVLYARRAIVEQLAAQDVLAPDTDPMDAIVRAGAAPSTTSVRGNEALRLLPPVQALFRDATGDGLLRTAVGRRAGHVRFSMAARGRAGC